MVYIFKSLGSLQTWSEDKGNWITTGLWVKSCHDLKLTDEIEQQSVFPF